MQQIAPKMLPEMLSGRDIAKLKLAYAGTAWPLIEGRPRGVSGLCRAHQAAAAL